MADQEAALADEPAGAGESRYRKRRRGWVKEDQALERLMFFSDAVIAIAMTLLALELPVPQGNTNLAVWHSFVHYLSRDYLTFLISFLVIATFWRAHHDYFDHVGGLDRRLVNINMLCLLMIVLVPFATRVLGDDGQFVLGTVLYASVISLVALCFLAMARYMVRAGLLEPSVTPASVTGMARESAIPAMVFLASIPIAFLWNVGAAKYSWLVLFVVFRQINRLLLRRHRARAGVTT